MSDKMQHSTKGNERLPTGGDSRTMMGDSANLEGVSLKVHFKTWIVVACVNFVYFAQVASIVGSGLMASSIVQTMGGASETVWFTQVLNILAVAISPPVSQMVDLWGRKWILVFLILMGFVGAIIVSQAHTTAVAIVGFTILGMNFGAQPILVAVASEVIPRKHRAWAQGLLNMSAGTGGVTGLMTGAALVQGGNAGNFRFYFYMIAAFFGVAMIGCALFYNPPPRELQITMTFAAKIRKLDWLGYALFAPGCTLFSIALCWSENPWPWSSARVTAPFVVGILMLVLLAIFEWRFAKNGILHHYLFRDRNFVIALTAIIVDGLSFFTTNAFFVMQYTIFTGSSLKLSAGAFSMVFVIGATASIVFGICVTHFKVVKIPAILGLSLIVLFNILMALTNPSTPASHYWGFAVFAGAGLASIVPTVLVTAQLSTPPHLISLASGLMVAGRALGGLVALAVNNSIFNSTLTSQIPKQIASATLPLGLAPSSLERVIKALVAQDNAALAQIPGITPDIIAAAGGGLLQAYHLAFRNCWITAVCLCAPGVIAACFLHDPREEFKAHIDAPLERELVEAQKRLEAEHVEDTSTHVDEKSTP